MNIPVPADIAESIETIAVARHVSPDRAVADLLQDAIAAYDQRRGDFLQLAERFQQSTDPAEYRPASRGVGTRDFLRLMPKIKWHDLPPGLLKRLFDLRAAGIEISDHLNSMAHGREIE